MSLSKKDLEHLAEVLIVDAIDSIHWNDIVYSVQDRAGDRGIHLTEAEFEDLYDALEDKLSHAAQAFEVKW